MGDKRWDDGDGARLWVVVWVGSLRWWRQRRSRTTATWWSNSGVTLRDVQMCCETTHSATYIRICIQVEEWWVPHMLRNGWFRNSLGGVWTCCGTTNSATCIQICIHVTEWVVSQQKQFQNTKSPQIHYKSYNRWYLPQMIVKYSVNWRVTKIIQN